MRKKIALVNQCSALVASDSHDNVREKCLKRCNYPHIEFRCGPVTDTDVIMIEEDEYR